VKLYPNEAPALISNIAIIVYTEACGYTGVCQELCPIEVISLSYEIVCCQEGVYAYVNNRYRQNSK
jgi:ferredoxin